LQEKENLLFIIHVNSLVLMNLERLIWRYLHRNQSIAI